MIEEKLCFKISLSLQTVHSSLRIWIRIWRMLTIDQLGRAKKVKVDKENTTIVDGTAIMKKLKRVATKSKRRSKKLLPNMTPKNYRNDLAKLQAVLLLLR